MLAEDIGFEPMERFTVLCFSKALHSTALPIFLNFGGRSWIRTNALLRPDLQSGAIDHSATFPEYDTSSFGLEKQSVLTPHNVQRYE